MAMFGIVALGGHGDGGTASAADGPATLSIGGTAPVTTPATSAVTSPSVPDSVPTQVCTTTYTVVAGDYWIRIADAASITLADLLAANQATAATALFPNQTVCLPDGASVAVTVAAPRTTQAAPKVTVAPKVVAAPTVTTSGSR